MEPEALDPADAVAFATAVETAFHGDPRPDEQAVELRLLEPARALVVRDGGRIVATAGAYSRQLTVPGGTVPAAAVSQVGVRPTHRRRGLLTALMRRQLEELHAGAEAVAILWASEGAIYGRFGYGLATWVGSLTVATRAGRLRADVPREGTVELTTPAEARTALTEVYEAVRPTCPGLLDRRGAWWDHVLLDSEERREGASSLRVALQRSSDGAAGGYAVYAVKLPWSDAGPDGTALVRELVATTPAAQNALWDYLLGMDLIRTVSYELAALDDPLPHLLTEPHAAGVKRFPSLWVRLTQVARALAQRTYAAPFELVLDVTDELLPGNAGRLRLAWDGARAACEPTRAPADISASARALGAAYLGGPGLLSLTAAGDVREHRRGALALATRAFRGEREPWCAEVF